MNYKIIETNHECPDVLVFRDRDQQGNELVRILAVGIIDNEKDMFAADMVVFPDSETARAYIIDFTVKSAEMWCKKEGISYLA